ncbi:MAG: hypothetical protein IJQ25_07890, partial [Oscillibacter sp.]|nr:hypothetical protein [Oscillibacter sp.]
TDSNRRTLELEDLQPASLIIGEGGEPEDPGDSGDSDDPQTPSDYQLYVSKAQKVTVGEEFTGEGDAVSAASAGEVVVLTISARNNATENVDLSGFSAKVYYDKDSVTPFTDENTPPFDYTDPYLISETLTGRRYNWSGAGNSETEEGFISVAASGSAVYTLNANDEEPTLLAWMAFQVNENASANTATFRFDPDATKTNLTDGNRRTLNIGTPQDFTLILGELVPTTVAVSPARATLGVPDGDTPATQAFTAVVQDQGGNTIPDAQVTWSLSPNVDGVTIDEDGTVSVASNAAVTADTPFTVTAASGDISGTATLTVSATAGNDLSATLNNETEQTVTPDGENDRTFQAAVTSQSGADTSGVVWSVEVEGEDGTRAASPEANGVTVDETGLVTVTASAVPGRYYVVATVGDDSADVLLTVQGSAVTSLTLDPAEATINVTADADPEPLTFTVTDNTGAAVDASTLTWTLSETPEGVTLENGTVTVDKDTFTGTSTVTVTAALSDDVSGTARLTIQEVVAAPVLVRVELSNETSTVDGMTAEPDRITATAIGDIEGIVDNVTWTVTPPEDADATESGVSLSADSGELVTLTVSPSAATGDYTITATQSAGEGEPVVRTATLTVSQRRATNMTVIGSRATIEIPGSNAADAVARFTATDSNNNPIRSDDLTWTVVDRSTGTALRRESVDWATDPDNDGSILLTVKPLAREEIFDTHDASGITGKTLVVTATRRNGDAASTTVVVRRADSRLSIVTLTLDEQSTSTGQAPLPISSTGNVPQYVTAVAKDQYEQVLDSSITWALRSGGGGLVISGSGVEINPTTGLITVSTSAQHGTYIVEATRTILESQEVASAEMTISQVAENATSLRISGGALEMKVPGKDDEPNVLSEENAFVANVLNQYGRVMPDAEVYWSITNSAGAVVEGVTIEDGRVQVSYAAKNAIGPNERPIFTVRATCGNVEGTASIYITRDAAYLADLLLEGQNSLTVSVDGTQDRTAQAAAYDQYETPYTGNVTWGVTPDGLSGDGGVSIDASGLITILRNASQGYYSVTAAEGANPAVGPKRLLVSRDAPYPASVIISGGQTTIWIPGDNADPAQSVPFTATVRDQFGSDMTGQNVLWTITDSTGAAITGITIEDGVVSVANEVKSVILTSNYVDFKTMNVGASCGSVNAVPAQIIVGRDRSTLSKVQL